MWTCLCTHTHTTHPHTKTNVLNNCLAIACHMMPIWRGMLVPACVTATKNICRDDIINYPPKQSGLWWCQVRPLIFCSRWVSVLGSAWDPGNRGKTWPGTILPIPVDRSSRKTETNTGSLKTSAWTDAWSHLIVFGQKEDLAKPKVVVNQMRGNIWWTILSQSHNFKPSVVEQYHRCIY